MDNESLIALRYVLADLYPTIEDSRRIVSDAGIPPAQIPFDRKAINNWFEILSIAKNRNKLLTIVQIARADSPENDVLKQIDAHGRLLSVRAPTVNNDLPWRGRFTGDSLEKLMEDESTLLPISFLEKGLFCSQSVARVQLENGELGSGFLTRDNIFVTNHHVFQDADQARTAIVQLNYQESARGLQMAPTNFALDPDNGFLTSDQDDWTMVRVSGDPNSIFGQIDLSRIDDIQNTKYVNIIQHPNGGPKQIALYHNVVAYCDDRRIQYLTDTLPGSSGSPVFDNKWRVVALHHSGGWIVEPGSKKTVFRNEGININLVVDALTQI